MTDLSFLTNFKPLVFDIILIFICAMVCLYCAILSRRLKKLNSLDTGVGASIVTLTEAINETYAAAKSVQNSSLENLETLRVLLEKSESAGPMIEAAVTDLDRTLAKAKSAQDVMEKTISEDLLNITSRAQRTAIVLLKSIKAAENKASTMTPSEVEFKPVKKILNSRDTPMHISHEVTKQKVA